MGPESAIGGDSGGVELCVFLHPISGMLKPGLRLNGAYGAPLHWSTRVPLI